MPEAYVPLRGTGSDAVARDAETKLEAVFAAAPAAEWVDRLRGEGLLVEPVALLDRDAFRRGFLDDPVNRELGRVASYDTADWGHFEQIGPLLRCGPDTEVGPRMMLPRVGEHTTEVLAEMGFDRDEIEKLLAGGVAVQL
jgi:crotonobetainyl-CoA:carnitine CoA-transferase CaiB-like acyl-CoA transferase